MRTRSWLGWAAGAVPACWGGEGGGQGAALRVFDCGGGLWVFAMGMSFVRRVPGHPAQQRGLRIVLSPAPDVGERPAARPPRQAGMERRARTSTLPLRSARRISPSPELVLVFARSDSTNMWVNHTSKRPG